MKINDIEQINELTLNPFELGRMAKANIRNYLDDKKLQKDIENAAKNYKVLFGQWAKSSGITMASPQVLTLWMRTTPQKKGLGVPPDQALAIARSNPDLKPYFDPANAGRSLRGADLQKFFDELAKAAYQDVENNALDVIMGELEQLMTKAGITLDSQQYNNRWTIAEALSPDEAAKLQALYQELQQWKATGLVTGTDSEDKVDKRIEQLKNYFTSSSSPAPAPAPGPSPAPAPTPAPGPSPAPAPGPAATAYRQIQQLMPQLNKQAKQRLLAALQRELGTP